MSSHCTCYVDLGDNPDAPRLQPGRNWDLLNLLLAGSREPTDHTRGFLVSDFVELAAEAHQIPAEDVASIAAAIVNRSTDDAVACFDTVQLSEEARMMPIWQHKIRKVIHASCESKLKI